MDLNGYITPPMNLNSLANIRTAGEIGHCRLYNLYRFHQIVKDFGMHHFRSPLPPAHDAHLGYPIDQLIYQY